MKRILSFFLAVVMCLTMFPAATDAAEAETSTNEGLEAYAASLQGSGTADDPYLIGSADDLIAFRKLVNGGETSASARLTNDITFHSGIFTYDTATNDPLYNGSAVPADLEQWIPIAIPDSSDFSFKKGWYTGTFDGAGHTISGLYCNYQTEVQMLGMSAASLFCGIGKGGVVKNVRIANSYFRGDGAASIALGCQGSIIACMNEGIVVGAPQISGNPNYAGGILCLAMYADAKVERCLNLGTVIGSTGNRGCIAAKNGIASVNFSGMTINVNIPGTSGFKHNYYLRTTSGTSITGCAEANAADLASGKIAYQLNSIRAGEDAQYGQTIGKDAAPYFGGETVYQVLACDGKTPLYSNTDEPRGHEFADHNTYGQCTVCAAMVYVRYAIQGGESRWVETLEEAFDAVAGTTAAVTLYRAVELSEEPIKVESGKITLDLNGYAVNSPENAKITFAVNGGDLTIQDSSNTGAGKITNTYAEEAANYGAITVNSGSLTVKSGTVEAVSNYALAAVGGTVRIEGGSFTSQLEHSAYLKGDVVLSGGGFKGITAEESLSALVAQDYGLKLVDEEKWDTEMSAKQYAGQIQVRSIPFTNAQVTPENASTFEGYTGDAVPAFTVTVEGMASTYRWYEVLADGTEQLLADQIKNTLTMPEGKPAGMYQYRWEAEEDDLTAFGYVTVTVLAVQGELPDVPTETEPTYPSVEPPTLETEPPQVEIPVPAIGAGVIGEILDNDIIVLDVAPLQGLTLTELAKQLSFAGLDEYTVKLAVSGNNGDGKVRTSDRMQVLVYNEDGKLLANRTFILCVMGDINCDGMTLANDAALVMRIKMGTVEAADEVIMAADLDQSGALSANDSRRLIYKYYNWDIDYVSVLK